MRGIRLFVVLFLLISSSSVYGQQKVAVFGLNKFEVVDQTGNSGIKEKLSVLVNSLLEKEFFLRFDEESKNDEFDVPKYETIPNVFDLSIADGDQQYHVEVLVEIEQVYYGPPQANIQKTLGAVWAFGPLIAAIFTGDGDPDAISGFVQFRMTIRSQEFVDQITIIGSGAAVGEIADLSRKQALDLATARAAWDTVFLMVDKMNTIWKLDLNSDFVDSDFNEYRRIVKTWIESEEF